MDGDFLPLREMVVLKKRFGAFMYVDEAHSIGAVGPTGGGVCELFDVPPRDVDVLMGTFAKSFSSAGGYVAASEQVINVLRQKSMGSTFAAAMPPPFAAGVLACFQNLRDTGAARVAKVRGNANYFRSRMMEAGFKVLGAEDSPIVPVLIHNVSKLATISRKCEESGVAVIIVGYPAVDITTERLRFSISAVNTRDQLETVVQTLCKICDPLGVMYRKNVSARGEAHNHAQAPLCEDPAQASVIRRLPEPLALRTATTKFAVMASEAARGESQPGHCDLRRFDPLGYGKSILPAATEAALASLKKYGLGACNPRAFYGTMQPHLDVEEKLANFLGTEAAIFYPAHSTTISSIIQALAQPQDRIIVDPNIHIEIRSGLLLRKASVLWQPLDDLRGLEEKLQDKGGCKGKTFVVAEAISQRTGQMAPLAEIVALKNKYGAFFLLDETLSFGAYGDQGKGWFEQCGIIAGDVDAIMGSLEHATASVGGFCAGRKGLVEHQRIAGSSYLFSASCPPCALSAAIPIIDDLPCGGVHRRCALHENAKKVHSVLQEAINGNTALQLDSDPVSYVQHIRYNSQASRDKVEEMFAQVAADCAKAGINIQACSPAVCIQEGLCDKYFDKHTTRPEGGADPSLRVNVSADSPNSDDLKALGQVLAKRFATLKID